MHLSFNNAQDLLISFVKMYKINFINNVTCVTLNTLSKAILSLDLKDFSRFLEITL